MKENFKNKNIEQWKFSPNITPSLVSNISDERIRSYKDSDYKYLSSWMVDLGKFYDGHDQKNKLLDQLVGTEKADQKGFFTKNKFMFICEVDNKPAGMICLNYKRGGSTKIGPVIVNPEIRGEGVGSSLLKTAEEIAITSESRKLYATTSHLNHPINHLFTKMGYEIEAKFPDQYKKGSEELIWGKHLVAPPICQQNQIESVLVSDREGQDREICIIDEKHFNFICKVNYVYQQWHDDLNDDFVQGMIAGAKRGLSFQNKGKTILISESKDGPQGMITFTPKRGGPVKLYPIYGSSSNQKILIEKAKVIARNNGNHKLYTFTHCSDYKEMSFLESIGFTKRGLIQSPYKLGQDLVPLDIFVE